MSLKPFAPPLALLAALFIALASGAAELEPGSLGPAPRTADGRFENFGGALSHGSFGVRSSFALRLMARFFRERPEVPERISNDGAFLRENAGHSVPTVTWIGHATLLVQLGHVTFLTDPIWSDRPSPISFMGPKRFVEPGIALADLPPIDFVVISHNHYDHLDLPTLRALAERDPETRFLVPLGNGALLRKKGIARVEEFDWGETALHEGVEIHCLPAQHWSKRGLGDDQKALWSSWAITGDDRRFFFAGDTGYFDGFTTIGDALGPFDLAAMPIGAYEPSEMMRASHMNPEESIRAAIDLRARKAVAIHFGTFDLSDEPLDEPPQRFLEAAAASSFGEDADDAATPGDAALDEDRAWVLRIGETRAF